ncbi:MAG: type II toxin-antitoxin system VapC family toxin [Immundisolibacter sp.]
MEPDGVKYLLDSVIVIDHLNGIAPATAFLADHASAGAVSVITRAEVLAGFDDANVPLARDLLDLFPALPITADTADLAARLRRRLHLKLPDALQAALAVGHELTLVTRNTRDFRSGPDLQVEVPYTV